MFLVPGGGIFRKKPPTPRFKTGSGRDYGTSLNLQWFQYAEHAQKETPIRVLESEGRTYWWFQDKFYWDNDGLSQDEVHALLVAKERKRQREIERAKRVVEVSDPHIVRRDPIPDKVKMFVWQRDQGRCVRCGSNESLEFDHIIPVVMGGANTARNLQLLCERCNREKGGNL